MRNNIQTPQQRPERQVRAVFDAHTITVYQAFSSTIAEPILAAERFVPPFKVNRMTWIKPSFMWMMYRSGWAKKPGQERILAIQITREGFEWALANSVLSDYQPGTYASEQQFASRKREAPVRIQWDPDRSLVLDRLNYRAIQVGLSGEAVDRYVGQWTATITDITPLAERVHHYVYTGNLPAARAEIPCEKVYPLPELIAARVGTSSTWLTVFNCWGYRGL